MLCKDEHDGQSFEIAINIERYSIKRDKSKISKYLIKNQARKD